VVTLEPCAAPSLSGVLEALFFLQGQTRTTTTDERGRFEFEACGDDPQTVAAAPPDEIGGRARAAAVARPGTEVRLQVDAGALASIHGRVASRGLRGGAQVV